MKTNPQKNLAGGFGLHNVFPPRSEGCSPLGSYPSLLIPLLTTPVYKLRGANSHQVSQFSVPSTPKDKNYNEDLHRKYCSFIDKSTSNRWHQIPYSNWTPSKGPSGIGRIGSSVQVLRLYPRKTRVFTLIQVCNFIGKFQGVVYGKM